MTKKEKTDFENAIGEYALEYFKLLVDREKIFMEIIESLDLPKLKKQKGKKIIIPIEHI